MSRKKEKFKTGKPGFGYRNGKLYRFEKKSVLVLAPWPKPQAWFKSHRKPWHSSRKRADKVFSAALYPQGDMEQGLEYFDPEEACSLRIWEGDPNHPDPAEVEQYEINVGHRPHLPDDLVRRRAKVLESRKKMARNKEMALYVRRLQAPYFDAIPDDVRDELLRYWNRRWHLLCLFARCPGSLDLSRSNPALCYALASNWVFHKPVVQLPMRAARSLIGRKQKHILGWLGFPATETARRIMAKLEPRVLEIKFMLRFRQVFENAELVKWLSHLERINHSIAEMVTTRRFLPFLSARLLWEASREEEIAGQRNRSASRMLADTLSLSVRAPAAFCPERFSSLRQLEAVHDDLSRQEERQWERERLTRQNGAPPSFPYPPYAGTENIQPILNPDDLHAEGREMGHCVGIYDERVARGECFIYRVTSPIRATMEIFLSARNRWSPGQLLQARNKPVPRALAVWLFGQLFASGKYIHEEKIELMEGGWAPEEHEDDRQMTLFNLDPRGELVPF